MTITARPVASPAITAAAVGATAITPRPVGVIAYDGPYYDGPTYDDGGTITITITGG